MSDLTLTVVKSREDFLKLRNVLANMPKREEIAHVIVSELDVLLNQNPEVVVSKGISHEAPVFNPSKKPSQSK